MRIVNKTYELQCKCGKIFEFSGDDAKMGIDGNTGEYNHWAQCPECLSFTKVGCVKNKEAMKAFALNNIVFPDDFNHVADGIEVNIPDINDWIKWAIRDLKDSGGDVSYREIASGDTAVIVKKEFGKYTIRIARGYYVLMVEDEG